MALIQRLIDPSKYDIKCPYTMNAEGICIHNTANDATADNEVSYMHSNNAEVSFHIAVDDEKAILALPLDRNAWAAGDGGKGRGNRYYIHVEICYSKSGGTRFLEAEKRAAKEIAALLKSRGWGIDRVKKHQDFSGKYCPHRTLDLGYQRIIDMIKAELNGYTSNGNTNSSASNSTTTPTGALYRVVVGSYSVRANAEAMMVKLKEVMGIDSFLLPVKGKDGKDYLRVIAGSYKDKANAEKVVNTLIAAEFNAFVAPYDANGNAITSTTPSTSTPTPSTPAITVGSKVNIISTASTYATGQSIPVEQKGSKVHTVQQISGEKVLLKEIVSWVYTKDVRITSNPVTNTTSNCDTEISRSNKSGYCSITEPLGIKFRNRPCTCHGTVQGTYSHGESLYYDMVVTTTKYTWVSWISSSTGARRYMPVKVNSTGETWAKY